MKGQAGQRKIDGELFLTGIVTTFSGATLQLSGSTYIKQDLLLRNILYIIIQ